MLEELFNRVSIRHYQNREVEQAKLEEMLRAAMNAPTARNTQSWRFLVITNRETLNHMTELQPYIVRFSLWEIATQIQSMNICM